MNNTAWLRYLLGAAFLIAPLVSCGGGGDGRGAQEFGINVSLNGRRPFPNDNAWNIDISKQPV
ncbi:MAG: hypothetical protein GX589_00410, partial [Deltaproteobacteria bacterium]|nr:hypothetical protein [Deltaproteobacteria bacterium]